MSLYSLQIFLLTIIFPFVLSASDLNLSGLSIRYDKGALQVLNQQKLPAVEEWISVEAPEQMAEIITSIKVRGAPLIGIAAILSLAQLAEKNTPVDAIEHAALMLRKSRPTAVNLANYIDRVLASMKKSEDPHQALLKTVEEIFHEDTALCQSMGDVGASLIQDGEQILTYCNTGSLATAGIGTALGVIKTAHRQGKKIHVFACETRPLLQGGRLTAWELEQNGIPYTLICDNMAATLMRSGKINRVLVGADRIAANGDFANKIGTYSLAVLAHHHHIPFHVVAPYTTIDLMCLDGAGINIEERSPHEVRGASGSFGTVCWSPKEAPVFNPAFDVTPHTLVTSYILDKGNLSADAISPTNAYKAGLKKSIEDIIAAGRFLNDAHLCPATGGNLSERLDSNLVAISVSGKHKGELTADDVMIVDLQGKAHNSAKKPSAETLLHTAVYSFFKDAKAVLHTHTVNGSVLSRIVAPATSLITEGYEMHKAFQGITTHESRVVIPIFENNQDMVALSKEVTAYLQENPNTYGFLVRGHGLYTWGKDMKEAKNRIETFEYLFDSELKSRTLK